MSSIYDYLSFKWPHAKWKWVEKSWFSAWWTIACIKKCMHNFAQFRFNWQSIQRRLRIKWAWRPNCPLTPEKGWSLLVTLTLHWPNSVTNLAVNPAVACICRLIAVFCLPCFLSIALLLNSITESFTIKKKKKCPDNHFCKWTLPSNHPLFNVGDINKTWTSCEGASCLNLSNCAVLLHILPFIVSLKQWYCYIFSKI